MGLLAAAEEEGDHEEDAGDEDPEEDALVARDHFCGSCGGGDELAALWSRQEVSAAAMASAMFCW